MRLDGVDISGVPLKALRAAIGVIPQEPVLFAGSLRENLDPYGASTNEQLMSTLERVQLGALKDGLDDPVPELSHGEKNLLAVAR